MTVFLNTAISTAFLGATFGTVAYTLDAPHWLSVLVAALGYCWGAAEALVEVEE